MNYNSGAESKKLKEIYEAHRDRMYIAAYRVLEDRYKAEDAVHEAFVAISRNVGRLGDVDSVSTASYVVKAAKNTALNMIKRSRRMPEVSLEDVEQEDTESLLDELCTRETYKAVVKAILELPENYRDVLSLYYLNELSVKEIAQLLFRKESTVKQQLSRGRMILINNIKKEVNLDEKRK